MKMVRVSIDANIVIDILTGNSKGDRSPEEWDCILELLDDFDRGSVSLVLPSALFIELLPSHHNPAVLADFFDVLRRDNVDVLDLSVPLARRVAAIRDQSIANSAKLSSLDAIYVATADMGNAEILYTVDSRILKNDGRL